MGSTGHGIYGVGRNGAVDSETFGIPGAVNYKGKVPSGSGLEKVGSNKITLKVPDGREANIIFQFKLSKDKKFMQIIGYRDGVPEVKADVDVDAGYPSLDRVIAGGNKSERNQAIKMKNLMNQSTKVDESQLGAIANALKKKAGAK